MGFLEGLCSLSEYELVIFMRRSWYIVFLIHPILYMLSKHNEVLKLSKSCQVNDAYSPSYPLPLRLWVYGKVLKMAFELIETIMIVRLIRPKPVACLNDRRSVRIGHAIAARISRRR